MVKKHEKLAELLMQAGLKRNIAKALAYIYDKEEAISSQIEAATGLRQPEVSIAMQWLREKGWVTKRDIKKEGKGRPVHGYRLAKPFKEIVAELQKNLEKEKKKIDGIIKELEKYK